MKFTTVNIRMLYKRLEELLGSYKNKDNIYIVPETIEIGKVIRYAKYIEETLSFIDNTYLEKNQWVLSDTSVLYADLKSRTTTEDDYYICYIIYKLIEGLKGRE